MEAEHLDSAEVRGAGERDVGLAVLKGARQVHLDLVKRLSLCFVDRHGPCEDQGDLSAYKERKSQIAFIKGGQSKLTWMR